MKITTKKLNKLGINSNCNRGMMSCIITRGEKILVVTWPNAFSLETCCTENGHDIYRVVKGGEKGETTFCVNSLHAEAWAIAQCASAGISTLRTTMYVSKKPCFSCAKLIVASGIREVFCSEKVTGRAGKIFKANDIKVKLLK